MQNGVVVRSYWKTCIQKLMQRGRDGCSFVERMKVAVSGRGYRETMSVRLDALVRKWTVPNSYSQNSQSPRTMADTN